MVGGRKGENSQGTLGVGRGPGWSQANPISFCRHLGVPGALLCADHQLKEVEEAKDQALSLLEAEVMK